MPQPTFVLDFNKDFKARTARGELEPIQRGTPSSVDGRVGKGMQVGHGSALVFPAADVLKPDSGAVSLWVKPLDWTPLTQAFHVFFDARDSGALFLYKFATDNRLLFLATRNADRGPHTMAARAVGWRAGEWHHLVGQWSKARLDLFIDGEMVDSQPLPPTLPLALKGNFSVGDLPWSSTPAGATIIDEVAIYDAPLSGAQVKALYEGMAPDNLRPVVSAPAAARMGATPASRPPPAPWRDIEIAGQNIVLTDKTATLSADGLPAQISVRGKPLLSGPVRILVDGQNLSRTDTPKPLASRKDRLDYNAQLSATANGQRMDFSLAASLEYDGLLSFTLSTPRVPEALIGRAITYRIPMARDAVRFLHRMAPVGQRNLDLETVGGSVVASSYLPFLWLGDDSHGLFWLSESNAGWGNAKQRDALRLLRTNDGWVLEVSVKPVPFTDGSWRHQFSLMPTPVKALPQGWRKWRLYSAQPQNAYIIWPNEKNAAMSYFGYPASSKPAAFSDYVRSLARSGVTAVPYACPTWVSTKTPEWERHHQEWYTGVSDPTFKGGQWAGDFLNVCSASESWRQFANASFSQFIKQYRLRGIYMDNAQAYATRNCLNPNAGAGVVEYPMLPQRDIYRTIVESLRENSPETLAIVHSSGGVNAPSFSMVDAWVNGEQYRDVVKNDYLDVASLTDFRVELNGAQWGFIPFFLPEFPADQRDAVAPTRKLMSILLLHDVLPWPFWSNVDEVNRGLAALDQFGVVDAEFVPYYAANPLAKVSQPGLYVSGYRRDDQSLLIVANLSRKTISDQLCLPGDGAPSRLLSWPGRREQPLVDQCANISLEAGSYATYQVSRGGLK